MAFDAGMLASIIYEISSIGAGGRIEKIYQPEKDEIVIQMRTLSGGRRLLINAGLSNPRISFTSIQKENPMQAPMFCMLLRKHLTGATLESITQCGFERVCILKFNTRDEMGYECKKHLVAEIMGKYSNLIFTDENMKVIAAVKTIDFSTSSLRQVLPGMKYELPPPQAKADPTHTDINEFTALFSAAPQELTADKFITGAYLGIASSTAREMVALAEEPIGVRLYSTTPERLYAGFSRVMSAILTSAYTPTIIYGNSQPIEYSFINLTHYGESYTQKQFESTSEMLDTFFESRDKEARIRQRAADLFKILTHAESRILKKLEAQKNELVECEMGVMYKRYGDLICANMYQLQKGQSTVELVDYEDWNEEKSDYGRIIIELDEMLSPAANAQKYYKKYNKSKTAQVELAKQIKLGEDELQYINTVFDALTKAETTADLTEIRTELYRSGYASKMKGYSAPKKQSAPVVAKFTTTNGYTVYCGKNNVQNEYITHKLAEKHDYWFHAKNTPGSHVLLVTGGEEPPEQDFTDAAEIAAFYSKANSGSRVEVDYLFAKGVKRVAGAKPGFVIYNNNWSAYVTPNEEKIKAMRSK